MQLARAVPESIRTARQIPSVPISRYNPAASAGYLRPAQTTAFSVPAVAGAAGFNQGFR